MALDPEALLRGKHVQVLIQSLVQEVGKHIETRIAALSARVEALERARVPKVERVEPRAPGEPVH